MIEVAARGDPAHAGRLRDRGGGQARPRIAQRRHHQVESAVREALGQAPGARAAQGAEDAVDLALVAGDAIDEKTRRVLMTPMAEALPWLLPDFRPTPIRD